VPEDQKNQRSSVSLDPSSVDRDSGSSVALHQDDDLRYMRACLSLAHEASQRDEVPVGAIVVHEDPETKVREVIGVGFNLRETTHDPTGHAEIVAMRRAAQRLGQWRLNECTLYVTLEPCPMCAGAIVNARIRRVVYGCDDPKGGAGRSLYAIMTDERLNHRVELVTGILAEESAQVLKAFFARRRAEKRAEKRATKRARHEAQK
jgi:tRNA(adenine34) deaminase